MSDTTPKNIGTDRQLFVDDYWIAESNGVTRRLHPPLKRETVLEREKPWEQGSVSYMGTITDGDKFKAYYRCRELNGKSLEMTAYQESDEGIHWTKPNLGIFEYEGSKDNDIVWMGPGANMAPFKDPNPNARDDEWYKAVVRTRDLLALVSPDGLNWRLMQEDPIATDRPFDSFNIAFCDPWREEYVAYTRGVAGSGGSFFNGVRWIRRTTSKDFRNWTPLESIDAGETPLEHLYTKMPAYLICAHRERI